MNIQYHSAGPCEENGGFVCPDGACIPLVYLCDKVIDCSDGLDEGNCTGENILHRQGRSTHSGQSGYSSLVTDLCIQI